VGEATRFLVEQVLDEPSLNEAEKLKDVLRRWQQARGS
jgi:tRNA nucleotidyltransferase (CCA-adding enzyme)